MFLSSVLERRTSLEPAASMLSPRTANASKANGSGHFKRLSTVNKENSVPGLYPSNKENCRPSEEQAIDTPNKKATAVGALDGLRKQLAQEEMLRARAEEALAEQCRNMVKERSSATLELERQKAYSRKLEQVLRGSELAEKHADLDEVQKQLQHLKSWTAKNEACLQQLNSKQAHRVGKSAHLEHRRLVSKVVQNAIVHALVTGDKGPEVVKTAQASQTHPEELEQCILNLEASTDAEASGEKTQQCQTDPRDVQLADVQSEAANLKAKRAELESTLQMQQAVAQADCKRWQQHVQDLERQLEDLGKSDGRPEKGIDFDERSDGTLAQNRQLLMTVSALKQECETIQAENKCLRETVADLEQSLDAVSGQHAELAGHVNHRQKIRHTLQIKQERDKLRENNLKLQQRVSILEASQSSQALMSALGGPMPGTPSCRGAEATKLNTSTPKNAGLFVSSRRSLLPCDGNVPAAERRCQQLERELDHISINFRHLTTLLERAFSKTGISLTARSDYKDISPLLEQLCELATLR
eukprot:TRINITY_DN14676_c0_g1_i1.p1 TRINITY_DN14676_c0_g1~~TRINITY_DN14676_c0_g1_i1.p1  ORF type:complete len:530 (+),score=128.98 TRINITY_DN14676_c0_g1_i1:42-1631(+)